MSDAMAGALSTKAPMRLRSYRCARVIRTKWVAPIRPVPDFTTLSSTQRADLARALKTVLLKYDGLWQRPFPYLMAWYQAPTDGQPHPESHLHAQFFRRIARATG